MSMKTHKVTFQSFMKFTGLLFLIFTLALQSQAETAKKKKSDPTLKIGVGLVAVAAGVVAFCALGSSSSNNNRVISNTGSDLNAISQAVATQQPTASQVQTETLPPVQGSALPVTPTAVNLPTQNLSCIENDQWNLRAFRVTALRDQLHNAVRICSELGSQWNRMVVQHGRTWELNANQIERFFGSSSRDSLADKYRTDLASYSHQANFEIVRRVGHAGYCSNMNSLYQQVGALRDSRAMVEFAMTNPQPLLSPCGFASVRRY